MNTSNGFVSKLTSDTGINYVNIALMIISLVAAYIIPFELFLFSYAVLGPLHYLTEISWLEKKNFFVKSKKDIWLFVVLVLLITVGLFNNHSKANLFLGSLIFSGFIYALIILYVEKLALKLVLVLFTFIFSILLKLNAYPSFLFLFFAVWLPTIIHVFIFTGAFILYGALKNKSKSGILSLLVFIACAFMFFIYVPDVNAYFVSDYVKKAYAFFRVVNTSLYELFGFGSLKVNDEAIFLNPHAIAIMRFIAFAYTYHYLNWFSKTSVIKWNQVSKKRMGAILLLWIVSVVLYIFSYKIGFYALFLLSMLHVFFEFPLNHQTFIGIGKEVKKITSR